METLSRELGLDAGYLSRILTRFEEQGLEGMKVFSVLDQRSRDEVAELLNELSEEEQQKFNRCTILKISLIKKALSFLKHFF